MEVTMKYKMAEITESCLGKMLDAQKNKGEYQPYLANINVRWGAFDLENLSLMRFEAHENYTATSSFKANGEIYTTYSESAFYNITKEQLAEICEAKTLEIKVRGSNGSIIESGKVFLTYCKMFYNRFYDNTKYIETQNLVPVGGIIDGMLKKLPVDDIARTCDFTFKVLLVVIALVVVLILLS